MELTVFERILLNSILPKEGDFTTIRIVRKLREDLSFSEEEHEVLKFEQKETGLTWSPEGNSLKEVAIGSKAKEICAKALEAVSEQKKLTEDFLHLCDL